MTTACLLPRIPVNEEADRQITFSLSHSVTRCAKPRTQTAAVLAMAGARERSNDDADSRVYV